ncbi:DUF6495 family protein [Flavicella marina]|uniref:DUF6495 family protein n=1 Tax=Flavicella marina TaxID=1475951 RepID=UPI002939517F|nr:DUF6495 family protein [Flavicella marina]
MMKYRQLTKEQFEELHEEFARFLASQKIDVKEWDTIKIEKPEVAEEELNIFSDVVWDDVLTKTEFIEHYSQTSINLFKCQSTLIERIMVKTTNSSINFLKKEGIEWLSKNAGDTSLEYFYAHKNYTKERNEELFDLVEKGGIMTKGHLYKSIAQIIKK